MNPFNFILKIKYILLIIVLSFNFFNMNSFAQDKNDHNAHKMNDTSLTQRQHMIHSNSPMVMPFDMNKVTHYFIKNESGGVLMIKVKDKKDTTQLKFVRDHLMKEKKLFSNADFKDPKTLHGMNMPGLKVLSESKGKFKVEYKNISDGAHLSFTSNDAKVINAIHIWFDAQLKDHGSDAKGSLN